MATISDRIIQRMKELKVRQVNIVEATGATKGAVSKWVAGTNVPKAEFLPALASVLKTSQNWLLTGEQEKPFNNFNMQEFIDKHGLNTKLDASFDVNEMHKPTVVDYETENGFIWIDVVEANFSCGTGEAIEFHFDVINGKFPFPPSFFQRKHVDPTNMRIIKAKGDSMSDFIHDGDMVGIDVSQTEIIDGEIYAVYFEGEGMIKQIFKEEGGKLTLHSLNPKYRDREVSEQNGLNFRVMGRQFWRAG
ncbi:MULTISPECIES: S24 family peptidase [unclassified Acinetobacter]|uniref:S24 family peptidase n=1 Tax=unclassified Acinetobacter TaxID=196816 RepID=UPI00293411F0|nr:MULTISPECIES: S24 family peptidase [unclassified Acinetobacter]WOE32777.1 S24 family peptidase [Acinetobacter sp. SAAs470]WOE38254.1 S24 family peptidase [Acinetobacter sp. SAAs474]